MWCSKVLVAYDGSTPSAKALDLAQSIGAQDERIELVFVHVLKLFALGTGAEGPLIEEANRVHAALQQLAERVPNRAHAHLLKGTSPADLLLKCAEDEGCDLIVMGSRGKGGVKGYLVARSRAHREGRTRRRSGRRGYGSRGGRAWRRGIGSHDTRSGDPGHGLPGREPDRRTERQGGALACRLQRRRGSGRRTSRWARR